jgi:hypothetical protein
MAETLEEQLARVESMSKDELGDTWDLSPHDRAALAALVAEVRRLRVEVATLREVTGGYRG